MHCILSNRIHEDSLSPKTKWKVEINWLYTYLFQGVGDTSHFLLHRDRITTKNFSPVICLGSSLINIQKSDTYTVAICKE